VATKYGELLKLTPQAIATKQVTRGTSGYLIGRQLA